MRPKLPRRVRRHSRAVGPSIGSLKLSSSRSRYAQAFPKRFGCFVFCSEASSVASMPVSCWTLHNRPCALHASKPLAMQAIDHGLEALHVPYSYGFAIIILTFLVKLATFPLTQKQVGAATSKSLCHACVVSAWPPAAAYIAMTTIHMYAYASAVVCVISALCQAHRCELVSRAQASCIAAGRLISVRFLVGDCKVPSQYVRRREQGGCHRGICAGGVYPQSAGHLASRQRASGKVPK
jgi:hypothetical protein